MLIIIIFFYYYFSTILNDFSTSLTEFDRVRFFYRFNQVFGANSQNRTIYLAGYTLSWQKQHGLAYSAFLYDYLACCEIKPTTHHPSPWLVWYYYFLFEKPNSCQKYMFWFKLKIFYTDFKSFFINLFCSNWFAQRTLQCCPKVLNWQPICTIFITLQGTMYFSCFILYLKPISYQIAMPFVVCVSGILITWNVLSQVERKLRRNSQLLGLQLSFYPFASLLLILEDLRGHLELVAC